MSRVPLSVLLLGLLVTSTAVLAADYEGALLTETAVLPIREPVSTSALPSPSASILAYSNIAVFSGSVYLHGGAITQVGNGITRLLADDLSPQTLPGAEVTSFTFSVANANSVPVTFRPRVRFWSANGPDSGPGDYYSNPAAIGFTFDPITVAGQSVTLLTASIAPGLFNMPQSRFWAGVTFDNLVGTTGATLARLDSLGQGVFGPPTVGTSTDAYFVTSSAGSFFESSFPPGTVQSESAPPANFGWEFGFNVVSGIDSPEPSVATMKVLGSNPFQGRTTVRFFVPAESAGRAISLHVYDVSGRRVRSLLQGIASYGWHEATWDAPDGNEGRVAAGVYFCRLSMDDKTIVKRLVLAN